MISWDEALKGWTAYARAAGRSEQTIELRLYHLRRCARELARPPALVTSGDLETWLARPSWNQSTRRSHRATLRVFYDWAVRAGLVASSPADWLPAVRVPRAVPRPTPLDAYAAAYANGDDRLRLALRLGRECGLRRGELVRVRGEHVEPDLIGWALRVQGKGDHIRMVPLPDDLATQLRLLDGWAFPSPRGGHLTAAHLAKLISRSLPAGITTHTLRHRAGTDAYAITRDLRAVQEFLGHARPETTAIYTEVSRESIRAAMRAAAAA